MGIPGIKSLKIIYIDMQKAYPGHNIQILKKTEAKLKINILNFAVSIVIRSS